MSTFVQLAFPVDAARSRPCARCARLSASPTAPASGARCTSCRMAADRAGRRCAVCGGPIPAGQKITARYCGPDCKRRRSEETRPAERDHAAGVPLERERCRCDRPLLVLDPDLGETRCLHCGRT